MLLTSLKLERFRNFESLDLPFRQGFVVLVGPNGSGKTNFLEGLYLGGTLRKFPESKFRQLFKKGESFFRIKQGLKDGEEQTQEIYAENQGEKYLYKLKINGQAVRRTKYISLRPIVSFLPQDLNLLTRSPGNRRRYLNETLSLVSAEYDFSHRQYSKTLKQRNELLEMVKLGKVSPSELEVWDQKLAEFGSLISWERRLYIQYLNENFSRILSGLSAELRNTTFKYHSSGKEDKDKFLEALRQIRSKEQELGTTLLGPHRDDFETLVDEDSAVGYVSRGQMRAITLAFKILEREYIESRLQISPILLLDDVFSEFDANHQMKLVEFLRGVDQVFLTTAHLEEIQKFLPEKCQIYSVNNGRLE